MKHKDLGEKEYLESYRQSDYERPSLTTDIVAFTLSDEEKGNYRKLPEKHLSLLLIQRGVHPYKNDWALPGGFVRTGETVEDTARRELREETGVQDITLSQLHCFSEPKRDPRGWIISCAFMALAEEEQYHIHSGDDAVDAQWFHVDYNLIDRIVVDKGIEKTVHKQYQLKLSYQEIQLSAIIEVRLSMSYKRQDVEYVILESNGIAFDHSKMITYALNQLRDNLHISMLVFELLPEYFTLRDLQSAFEVISGQELLPANFRRKIAEYVVETEKVQEGHGHRPAKLYVRNYKKLSFN